jgi:hypothetical protein
MRDPELNDSISDYSAADRAIIRAALNQARLDNKKAPARKTVTKKVVASKPVASKPVAKKPAPKPTDSRFKGVGAGAPKPKTPMPKDSRFTGTGAGKPKPSGSMSYTPGSDKGNKAAYTTGSGVKYKQTAVKPGDVAAAEQARAMSDWKKAKARREARKAKK